MNNRCKKKKYDLNNVRTKDLVNNYFGLKNYFLKCPLN